MQYPGGQRDHEQHEHDIHDPPLLAPAPPLLRLRHRVDTVMDWIQRCIVRSAKQAERRCTVARMARRKRARRPSRAETKERLLAAAERVFIRRGLQAASIEQIAEEAGLTRGAFYSNFQKKEELFVELLHTRVYDSYREILERTPNEGPPLERLRGGVRQLMKQYERREGQWLFALWLELLAHVARHPEFRELAASFWRGNRALLEEIIEQVYREHGETPPIPPKDLATAQIALDIGLAVQNLVDEEEVPLDLYPTVYDVLFAPLLPPGR